LGRAQAKARSGFDHMSALPMSWLVLLLAEFAVWMDVPPPGVVLALAFGMAIAHLSPPLALTGVVILSMFLSRGSPCPRVGGGSGVSGM
jgi:hypothetical protein